MDELPPPIPAATLVLMRAQPSGPPLLLMMERPGHMAFAAGALVFPGGRVEDQDRDLAAALGLDEDGARAIAAIRETLEETGITAGFCAQPSAEQTIKLRADLLGGTPIADALSAHDLALDPAALVPFTRWCPNFKETRRFDATFFLAEAGPDMPEPSVQAGEASRVFWASAADVLAELAADRAHAIFPTRRNLERLARFGSFAEALADTAQHPVRMIVPWVEKREEGAFLCIPDDAGYPVTSESMETARRR